MPEFFSSLSWIVVVGGLIFVVGILALIVKCYRKVPQGLALVRTGQGGTRISFTGMLVIPVLHRAEFMDISVKRIEIDRTGSGGLICKDNMRADIKVAFFVRVNPTDKDVKNVAQAIGCERASSQPAIEQLFDAKFSEALKTVGKRFDFIELYEERETFRDEILKLIGTDLNGFSLEDAAIDYLEQTPLEALDPDNILDSEGIKKITELTAAQAKLANNIQRDKEKVIKQQDVETREAILELERQQAEAEAKQKREVESVQAREEAETAKIQAEEKLKSERARIATEEEVEIATQNKEREVLVAQRNKERTDAVEQERVKRDRELESIERERVTTLKDIEKEKAVEVERKAIQDVIKERVAVEKTVVEEQQKILDTEAFAGADREKQVAVTLAEKEAQESLVKKIKEAEAAKEAAQLKADQELYEMVRLAEAEKQAAELHAQEVVIKAEAEQTASEKLAIAKKTLAEGVAAETAATGLGEAEVIGAKADAEARGITSKADAMKKFNEAGKEHEEFKLELEKEKAVELAEIDVRRAIAAKHSEILAEALKSAKIDIVGGETTFFDQITNAITKGKAIDRMVDNSTTLSDVRDTFFNGDPEYFKSQIASWIDQFGVSSEDLKNLTISALLTRMMGDAEDDATRTKLGGLLSAAKRFGLENDKAGSVLKKLGA
ncbi:MAG: flotillin family protein [Verrucomicrobiae bacterium]|nr:flotillin family protein [Verrucomicrobiae bacterium]